MTKVMPSSASPGCPEEGLRLAELCQGNCRKSPLMLWLAPAWTGAPMLPPCPYGPWTLKMRGDQPGSYPPWSPPPWSCANRGLWQPSSRTLQDKDVWYPNAEPTDAEMMQGCSQANLQKDGRRERRTAVLSWLLKFILMSYIYCVHLISILPAWRSSNSHVTRVYDGTAVYTSLTKQ